MAGFRLLDGFASLDGFEPLDDFEPLDGFDSLDGFESLGGLSRRRAVFLPDVPLGGWMPSPIIVVRAER